MFYTYVVRSKKDLDLYIGSTNDLRKSIKEHNSGMVKSTKLRMPFEVVCYEVYKPKKDARKRETKFKIKVKGFCSIKKAYREQFNLIGVGVKKFK